MHALFRRNFLGVLICILLMPLSSLAQQDDQVIKMSTTTSTENSGLLSYLLPLFEAETGLKVQVIAVGTGKALELAKNGDIDVTLVHARAAEDKFVAEGYGVNRRDVMYNDFIIVGPRNDPAGVRKAGKDVVKGFKRIIDSKSKFISRGDNSGTDQKEQEYWQLLGAKPNGNSYISAGLGIGEVLNMAAQMQAYTLTDRATYLAYRAKTGLAIALEGDSRMANPYGIIAVNPEKHKHVKYKATMRLIDWITSRSGQQKIALFTIDGQQVFFPNAESSR